jgi:PAS domain S-box-containing protein
LNDETSGDRAQSGTPPEHLEKQVFEHSAVGIAVAELDGRFLTANSAFQSMVGYTEPELRELTALDLAEEADRPATRDLLSQLREGAVRQYQEEHRARRKDGSLIWLRKTVSLIPAGPRPVGYLVVIAEDITERKRAADELRKQHEILQKIFDTIPLMINFTGADGRINLVNREWERTLGWTLEEIQSRGIDIYAECYPDALDRREAMNHVAAAKCEWADFKTRVRDGRTLDTAWAEVRLSDGTTIGIGVDITERKRTEEALRESEQRFRQLAEHVVGVLWIADLKTRQMLYVSPAYERICGRSRESLYRDMDSFLDAIHPEDRQRRLCAIEAHVRSKIPLEVDYRVIRPDGSTRWIRNRSFPVRDAAGDVYRLVGIGIDITEQKRAEEQLRRSEAYLEETERLSHLGTWALKISTREIVYWSPGLYRIYGFDPGRGLPTLEAVLARTHPEDIAVLESMKRAVREKKDMDLHFRILLPDGTVRHIHSLGHPLVNQAGEVEFSGKSRDVTEGKLAEDALQRSLEQVRALAARVESVREEERTRLARQIHDDLGQALTGIKMDLTSLLHHPPVRRQERARRGQAMLELIDGAIESVRKIATELRPGILDDLGLVAAVEWAAEDFAARTGTKCALELPQGDLAIEPEAATALFRILQEALTNIARHAEATELSVRLARSDGDLCLEVRDNGKGFNEANLAPGRSLGIMGMRERALLLGGRLTIQSSPGEGAAVTAWIPQP